MKILFYNIAYKLIIIFLVCISFFLENALLAKNYYVSPSGSDNYYGSINSPFRTIQKAADVVNPGDSVVVKDGIYTDTDNDNFIVNLNRGGNSNNWIIFKSENKWGAVLDGENYATDFGWNFTSAANYIRIENFEVKACLVAGFWSNAASHHIYFYKNHIHHNGRPQRPCPNGEYISGGRVGIYAGSYTSYHTYNSNVFHTNGRIPSGCTAFDYNHDHGIYSRSISYVTIINNIFYDHEAGWHIAVANPNTGDSSFHDITINNNTFVGTNPGRTGNAILINNSPESKTIPIRNITIKNNIIYGTNNCAMKIVTEAENVLVSNNLIYPEMDISCVDGYPPDTFEADNLENNIVGQDPNFVDLGNYDFRLLPDSPAIDNGNVEDAPEYDIEGNHRYQNLKVDIGAYEFMNTDLPTAQITLNDSSPLKKDSVLVTLTTSKDITNIPTPLILNESDGTSTLITLSGSVPGNIFTGVLILNSVADGKGYFSLSPNALIDVNDNVGNEITSGAYVEINRYPPEKPKGLEAEFLYP